ncbi:hypothetical protein PVAG01_03684 [Phlyctema vagabunda]|uniref:BTB domain-containing protein n=1 Tax=Phlyctema vagabunda TaxID=108571 RepID=A0ABR4PME9_9HELO
MSQQVFDPDADVVLILYRTPVVVKALCPQLDSGINDSNENKIEDTSSPAMEEANKALKENSMLVSSRHMKLASPVFNKMLQPGCFQEGSILHAQGKVEIPLPDDDFTAFVILLDIIHGHTRKVPRHVSFDLLKTIAILIDKYEMHEVAEVYTDRWFIELKNIKFPQRFTIETIPWIFITWVFKRYSEFRSMTRLVQLHCTERLKEEIGKKYPELPIPEPIIGMESF